MRRERAKIVDQVTKVDDGSITLTEKQIEEKAEEIAETFKGMKATGAYSTRLVAPSSSSRPLKDDLPEVAQLGGDKGDDDSDDPSMKPAFSGFRFSEKNDTQQRSASPGERHPVKKSHKKGKTTGKAAHMVRMDQNTPVKSAGRKVAGRPSRDLLRVSQAAIMKFQEAKRDDNNFYGSEVKTQKRQDARLLDDVHKAAEINTTAAEYEQLDLCRKGLQAMIDIHHAVVQHGECAAEFAKVYDDVEHFCSLPPVVVPFFPKWMTGARMQLQVASVSLERFWSSIHQDKLLEVFSKPEYVDVQARLISERIVCITKQVSQTQVDDDLRELIWFEMKFDGIDEGNMLQVKMLAPYHSNIYFFVCMCFSRLGWGGPH